MTHAFRELVIGGVLVAPPIWHAVWALVVILVLRPILDLVGFSRVFSHPPIAELSLYISVLGLLVLLF
jgi:uncharacterized protein DUF1656